MTAPRRTRAASALTELIVETFRTNGALLALGDRMTGQIGQSSARWQVLAATSGDARTVSQIARAMGLTRQSVQRTANLLVADGLAELHPNPEHRRAKLLSLTPAGKRVLGAIERAQVDWSNEIARGLPAADLRTAVRVLGAFRARLEGS